MDVARDWFVKHGPKVDRVLHGDTEIEDHLGKAYVGVTFWANGEGFEIAIQEPAIQPGQVFTDKRIELTWSEWDAIRWTVKKMKEEEKRGRP